MAEIFFQMSQRNSGNTDWDNLYPQSKFETAGGSSTAITLNIPNLVDGISKTFIANANNNSAATKINGKNLYKPNTTTAPNLTAGKAYTVWYNKSKDCFFIKASAEGNTVADHVLAGDTFSNDSDTGLVGTMDLKAENIKDGTTYAGITGTLHSKFDLSKALFNLPDNYPAIISPVFELDELWVSSSTGQNTPIYRFDESGNKIATLNLISTERAIGISKNYILTCDSNGSPWVIRLYNKSGTLLKQGNYSVVPSLSFLDEKNSRIIIWNQQAGSYLNIYDLNLTKVVDTAIDNTIRDILVNKNYIILIDGDSGNLYFIDNENNVTVINGSSNKKVIAKIF